MTLKTPATDPLDRYSLAEWRTELCGLIGIDYSSQPTAWQTMFDSIVPEAEDFLLKRSVGQPWGEREQSSQTVSAGTDTTYAMPSDFREVIRIREESSTKVLLANITRKREYFDLGGNYGTEHPWENAATPYWFFDGHNSASPAAQQWRRIGADNAGATLRIYYIPRLSLGTPELPAEERSAIRTYVLKKIKLLSGDLTHWQALRQDQEDEITATDKLGRETADLPMRQGVDDDFARQMG